MSVLNLPNSGINLDLGGNSTPDSLATSEFAQGGSMAPTATNNYGGSTTGQGQLLNNSQQQLNNTSSSNGVFGMSPNQVGNLAGKATNSLINPNSNFNSMLDSINNEGTNFGFGGPAGAAGVPTAAESGDLALSGINDSSLLGGSASTEAGTLGTLDASTTANGAAGLFNYGITGDAIGASDTAATGSALESAGEAGLTDTLGVDAALPTLTSTLGAAGLGAIGGDLISKVSGGNQTGSEVGGAIGTAAGYYFGGPIGGAVGDVAGSLIGGLFGNTTTPTAADAYGGTVTADGAITGASGGSKNPGQYANFGQQGVAAFSTLAQNASQALGIQFAPNTSVNVRISTQHGGAFVNVDGTDIPFDQTSATSTQNAYTQALQIAAQNSGYTNTTALNNYISTITASAGTGLPQATPNVPTVPGTQAGTIAQQNQGTQNAASTATPTV